MNVRGVTSQTPNCYNRQSAHRYRTYLSDLEYCGNQHPVKQHRAIIAHLVAPPDFPAPLQPPPGLESQSSISNHQADEHATIGPMVAFLNRLRGTCAASGTVQQTSLSRAGLAALSLTPPMEYSRNHLPWLGQPCALSLETAA